MADKGKTFVTGTSVPASTFEIVGQASAQASAQTGSSGEARSAATIVGTASRARSFSVYYDRSSRGLKVYKPVVIVGGDAIDVEGSDDSIGEGQLVCSVWVGDGEGPQAKLEGNGGEEHEGLLAKVPIAFINDTESPDGVQQQHVGAIVIGAVVKFDGDAFGSEEISASSSTVEITGDDTDQGSSGIEFKTVKPTSKGDSPKIVARIKSKGTDSDRDWQARTLTVKDEDGEEVSSAEFLGSKDIEIQLPESGGGGSDEVTVVTGFELAYKTGELTITWHKAKIKDVTTESVAEEEDTLLTLEPVDAVVGVAYEDKSFTQVKQTIYVPGAGDAEEPETVFTAKPHSEV